jgi:CHAT domain-containing protein
VLELNRLLLDEAELAFLSACATARTGARLPDEAIHLASAFQLAGYRHVISTLWPIADRPAVRVAEVFYAGVRVTGADGAPRALRDATRRGRGLVASKPSMWAAHIHSGA